MSLRKERRAFFKILSKKDVSRCAMYSDCMDAVFDGQRAFVLTFNALIILIPYGDLQYKTSGNSSLIA